MSKCKCDLRTRLVGDGCETCNPQMAIDLLKEQVREQAEEIARLRAELSGARQRAETGQPVLTDAERADLQTWLAECLRQCSTATAVGRSGSAARWQGRATRAAAMLARLGGVR